MEFVVLYKHSAVCLAKTAYCTDKFQSTLDYYLNALKLGCSAQIGCELLLAIGC